MMKNQRSKAMLPTSIAERLALRVATLCVRQEFVQNGRQLITHHLDLAVVTLWTT